MWDRKELKAKGKRAFLANYWRCVLVALLITLVLTLLRGRKETAG